MYNYKLIIEFDGLSFNGWQKQLFTDNTVQDQIEIAIRKILKKDIKIIGAGRTDAKVSAYNQTANFFYEDKLDLKKITNSLNSVLPETIAIKNISVVSKIFHSRYSAKKREYIYKICLGKKAVSGNYYHRINYIPDFNKIDKFIKFIKKVRNFKSLCKNKDDIRKFECVIFDFRYKFIKSKKELIFTISANRFLHSMVRAIIGSALDIGRGKEDLINVIKKIEKGERLGIPYLPGNALFLNKIYY